MKNDRKGASRVRSAAGADATSGASAPATSRAGAGHERQLYHDAHRAPAEALQRPGEAHAPAVTDPDDAGADAIHRLLGELESEIMATMWRRGAATVRDVLGELTPRREIAYTTVMTVMARLAEKGLLHRRLQGKAHWYEVAQSRGEFLRNTSQRLVRSLIDEFGDVAVAAMLQEMEHDIGRVDPNRLERLRRLSEGTASTASNAGGSVAGVARKRRG